MENLQANKEIRTLRMYDLIETLNKASDAYYGSGQEIMSNKEWDALYDELAALEKETGIVMTNSPTRNIGAEAADNSTFAKVEHEIFVGSLEKTKEVEDLESFLGARPGVMSWKLDGLTVVLTYDNGVLQKAVTRGKNGIGELITANARHFLGVPETIPFKGHLNVRGEALISYADFEIVSASLPEGEEPYKNPRNLAAGSVRQADSTKVKDRHVRLVVFSSDHEEATHIEEFQWLDAQGFMIVPHNLVKSKEEIEQCVEDFRQRLPEYGLPTDGLVLQFNETTCGKFLGTTNKSPRDAIAFKWADEEKETTIKEIFWSPSRTGLITPVAVFEPVSLEGTIVERASVHNVSILRQLSLRPGDTVTVYKANMIIPQISANLTALDEPVIPDACPACGGRAEIREGRDGSLALYCTNPDCSAKHIKRFVHAVKQDALNIVGLSEMTLTDFIEHGYLHTLGDLFRLNNHAHQIVQMEGYGRKSVDNLLASITKARTTTLQKLIYAFGIEFVGRTASKVICKHFNYDVTKTLTATRQELMTIEGVGEAIADSYVKWFADPVNQELFEDLLKEVHLVVPAAPAPSETAGKPGIRNKTIVITGDVYQFANRNAFKAWVEEHGGKVTGSVSRNTDYLVTNTPNSGTTKNKKAQELGVEILTEQQIIDLVE